MSTYTTTYAETTTMQNSETGAPPTREFLLSRQPQKALQEMIAVMTELCSLYAAENEALSRSDTKAFMALQERKIAVAHDYQSGVAQIVARRKEFQDTDSTLRDRLRDLQKQFTALTATNLDGISRIRNSVQRLSERILHAARESVRQDTPNYGASGSLNTNTRAVSFNLNESA